MAQMTVTFHLPTALTPVVSNKVYIPLRLVPVARLNRTEVSVMDWTGLVTVRWYWVQWGGMVPWAGFDVWIAV